MGGTHGYAPEAIGPGMYSHMIGSSDHHPDSYVAVHMRRKQHGRPLSWIEVLRESHKTMNLRCCACSTPAEHGAHMIASGRGIVVPMCSVCHAKKVISINYTQCVYDEGDVVELEWGRCGHCPAIATFVPDEDEALCTRCGNLTYRA